MPRRKQSLTLPARIVVTHLQSNITMTNDLNFKKKLLHSFDDISTRKTIQKDEFIIRDGETEKIFTLLKQAQ